MLLGRKVIGTVAFMGGVPAVLTDFARSWGKMIQYTMEFGCDANETIYLDDAPVSFHSWARNSLVDRMLGDWLFMMDTDHAFEPDLLVRMLHRMNEFKMDVLVGVYCCPKGTIVLGRETKAIEEIKVGDLVWTDKGRLRPVTHLHRRKYAGKLL